MLTTPQVARIDERLLSEYYGEFRIIARRVLSRSGDCITLQPTELVHEAAMRLLAGRGVWIRDEVHFLALGARVIRTTLIDEIRRKKAIKLECEVVTLWDEDTPDVAVDVENFDRILDRLADIEPESAKIVEMRFFVGMTMQEIARVTAVSESTVHRRWRVARAWMFKEMREAA